MGSQQVDHSARWLAAVQLKNSINKHWRPRYDRGCGRACRPRRAAAGAPIALCRRCPAAAPLPPPRQRPVAGGEGLSARPHPAAHLPGRQPGTAAAESAALPECATGSRHCRPSPPCARAAPSTPRQIAVQVALMVAKAARFDFPAAWPTLFTELLAGLSAGEGGAAAQPLLGRRTYFVLHHVLKELSTKRLAADQKAFAQARRAAGAARAARAALPLRPARHGRPARRSRRCCLTTSTAAGARCWATSWPACPPRWRRRARPRRRRCCSRLSAGCCCSRWGAGGALTARRAPPRATPRGPRAPARHDGLPRRCWPAARAPACRLRSCGGC